MKKHLWCLKIEQSIPALLKPNLGHKRKTYIFFPSESKDRQSDSVLYGFNYFFENVTTKMTASAPHGRQGSFHSEAPLC